MINIERTGKIDIVSFTVNKINAFSTEDIREEISRLSDVSDSKIIIDLKGVEYIDSSGFGCFLSIMRTVRNNYGTMKFANPEPGVMEVFGLLKLDTVFQIYDDIDTCIMSFR